MNNEYIFKERADSWVKIPNELSQKQIAYIETLESVFKVQDAKGDWVKYELQNHQINWHLRDVALVREKAKHRIVIKSRNTSFTVSAIISDLMAVGIFKNNVVPYIKLKLESSIDLLNSVKNIIKHMTPITKVVDGVTYFFPFNPKEVNFSKSGSITFPNETIWRGFPANADASESVRGERLLGYAGLIDESNFMRTFPNIIQALKNTSRGAIDGKVMHQINIGTTLKGDTNFYLWFEKILESKSEEYEIFYWQVFDPKIFAKFGYETQDCSIPFHENDELVSIVKWHDRKTLWKSYKTDLNVFLEENMAIKTDGTDQFFPTSLVLSVCDSKNIELYDFSKYIYDKFSEVAVGIDVASINDYFVISVFGRQRRTGIFEQFYLEYENNTTLPIMKKRTIAILDEINNTNIEWKCSVDSVGIGIDLSQELTSKYYKRIKSITGGTVSDIYGNKFSLKQYMFTNLKSIMSDSKIILIQDEVQFKHFNQINYNYEAERHPDIGHGDIAYANAYALLDVDISIINKLHEDTYSKLPKKKKQPWYIKQFNKMKGKQIKRYSNINL